MKLLKSFGYAFRGIYTCLCLERNFRIHLVAAITVLTFSRLYGLPLGDYPPILLAIALVMGLEAVNTAVERAVTLASPERSTLARIAKDTAAAGVLLGALGSVAVAVTTFSDLERLNQVLTLLQNPFALLGLMLYIVVSAWFVFCLPITITKED